MKKIIEFLMLLFQVGIIYLINIDTKVYKFYRK